MSRTPSPARRASAVESAVLRETVLQMCGQLGNRSAVGATVEMAPKALQLSAGQFAIDEGVDVTVMA